MARFYVEFYVEINLMAQAIRQMNSSSPSATVTPISEADETDDRRLVGEDASVAPEQHQHVRKGAIAEAAIARHEAQRQERGPATLRLDPAAAQRPRRTGEHDGAIPRRLV